MKSQLPLPSKPMRKLYQLCVFACSSLALVVMAEEAKTYDIVVYGGTSGGVTAGIQAARMGKSVVIIEPTKFLGGLTTGGLGATDIGNKQAIGGMSREFYHRIWQHYQKPETWKQQTSEEYYAKR